LYHAEELFGVSGEELGDVVSKYAKIHQPVPFSSQTPKGRLSLEWYDVNYNVVVPLPPKNIMLRLLFKLPIPSTVTNKFKPKKEIPILNHVSGKIYAGQVVAIMGPTGSGKVRLQTHSVLVLVWRSLLISLSLSFSLSLSTARMIVVRVCACMCGCGVWCVRAL
jgi:ABC-type multidrug transport system fused ATPase/permease subunit